MKNDYITPYFLINLAWFVQIIGTKYMLFSAFVFALIFVVILFEIKWD